MPQMTRPNRIFWFTSVLLILLLSAVRQSHQEPTGNGTSTFGQLKHFVESAQESTENDTSTFARLRHFVESKFKVVELQLKRINDRLDSIDQGAVREDNRCANLEAYFPGPNGQPAKCIGRCCSRSGWCGDTSEYCDCEFCIDYRGKNDTMLSTTSAAQSDIDGQTTEAPLILALSREKSARTSTGPVDPPSESSSGTSSALSPSENKGDVIVP